MINLFIYGHGVVIYYLQYSHQKDNSKLTCSYFHYPVIEVLKNTRLTTKCYFENETLNLLDRWIMIYASHVYVFFPLQLQQWRGGWLCESSLFWSWILRLQIWVLTTHKLLDFLSARLAVVYLLAKSINIQHQTYLDSEKINNSQACGLKSLMREIKFLNIGLQFCLCVITCNMYKIQINYHRFSNDEGSVFP